MESCELTTATQLSEIDTKLSEKSFGDVLDKLCGYYMLCGVSCDDYWNGDYTQLKYYVERHKLAVEEKNREMWLQGIYFDYALVAVLSKALSKKGEQTPEYPKQPIRITPLSEEEKKQQQEKTVNDFRTQLLGLCKKFETRHRGDNQA